jgi:hypothetical protein
VADVPFVPLVVAEGIVRNWSWKVKVVEETELFGFGDPWGMEVFCCLGGTSSAKRNAAINEYESLFKE